MKLSRHQEQILSRLLRDGERIEIVSLAKVGTVPMTQAVTFGTADQLVSAGVIIGRARASVRHVVLTSHRLLWLKKAATVDEPASNVIGQLPRPAITGVEVGRRLHRTRVTTAIAGHRAMVTLAFASCRRRDGQAIASALNSTRFHIGAPPIAE